MSRDNSLTGRPAAVDRAQAELAARVRFKTSTAPRWALRLAYLALRFAEVLRPR
jgi:hypothetical protein